jgi:hypothetical protein
LTLCRRRAGYTDAETGFVYLGGYLTVWPSDAPRPGTSNVNFAPGATLSELVIAKVAPDGTVSIYNAAGTVDVIGDVSGCTPAAAPPTSPSAPCASSTPGPG